MLPSAMAAQPITELLEQAEAIRYSKPTLAYVLVKKAAAKALQAKDLLLLAKANELQASLARTLGDLDIARSAAQSALIFYRANKLTAREANTLMLLGQNELLVGNYEKAIDLFKEAQRLIEQDTTEAGTYARAIGMEGNALINMGKPVVALKLILKALGICERFELQHERGILLQNLASFYILQQDYTNSIRYGIQALPFLQAANDRYSECYTLNNLGIASSMKSEDTEAFAYFKKALPIAQELEIINILTWSQSNLIEQQIKTGQIKAATASLKKLVHLSEVPSDFVSKASILMAVASFYLAINRPKEAIRNFRLALDKIAPFQFGKANLLEQLVGAYIQANEVDNALATLAEYLALKDELFSAENQRQISSMEAERELQKNVAANDEVLEKYTKYRLEKKEFWASIKQQVGNKIKDTQWNALEQASSGTTVFDHDVYLHSTYQDFISRLSKRYPSLSATELKIATLLRLATSTKNIAVMLSLSTRTVEYHRTNIRKKMGLKTMDNLSLFLIKI